MMTQKFRTCKTPLFCARDVKGLALFVALPLMRHKKAEAIAEPGTARPGALLNKIFLTAIIN